MAHDDNDESAMLLPRRTSREGHAGNGCRRWVGALKLHLCSDIDKQYADLILITCYFVSGLIDSASYNAYQTFCSMQTGNTIFVALGVSDLPVSAPRLAWTKSLVSIASFFLGAILLSTLHRVGPRRRWVLATSFLIQTICIGVSADLVRNGYSSGSPAEGDDSIAGSTLPRDPGFPWTDLIPVALLAFQAAGKVVASRALEYNPLTAVVLTTLYADMVSDPRFLTAGLMSNAPRNRKLAAVALYFAGAVLGGVAASSSIKFTGGLIIATAIQLAMALAWLVWRSDDSDAEAPG